VIIIILTSPLLLLAGHLCLGDFKKTLLIYGKNASKFQIQRKITNERGRGREMDEGPQKKDEGPQKYSYSLLDGQKQAGPYSYLVCTILILLHANFEHNKSTH